MINAEDFDNFDDFEDFDDFDSEVFHGIHIHAIIYTKDHQKLIQVDLEGDIYDLMVLRFEAFKCDVLEIGGMQDHVHILFKMGVEYDLITILDDVRNYIKEFINDNNLSESKFEWDEGFAAFSESTKSLPITEKYIQKQEEHHRKKTTEQELNEFLIMHGLENNDDGFNLVSLN